MARRMGVGLVLRIDGEGHLQVSEALRRRLEFPGKPPELTVVP